MKKKAAKKGAKKASKKSTARAATKRSTKKKATKKKVVKKKVVKKVAKKAAKKKVVKKAAKKKVVRKTAKKKVAKKPTKKKVVKKTAKKKVAKKPAKKKVVKAASKKARPRVVLTASAKKAAAKKAAAKKAADAKKKAAAKKAADARKAAAKRATDAKKRAAAKKAADAKKAAAKKAADAKKAAAKKAAAKKAADAKKAAIAKKKELAMKKAIAKKAAIAKKKEIAARKAAARKLAAEKKAAARERMRERAAKKKEAAKLAREKKAARKKLLAERAKAKKAADKAKAKAAAEKAAAKAKAAAEKAAAKAKAAEEKAAAKAKAAEEKKAAAAAKKLAKLNATPPPSRLPRVELTPRSSASVAPTIPIPVKEVPRKPTLEERAKALDPRIQKLGNDFRVRFDEEFDMSWIYHDASLEGVVFTFEELTNALRSEEVTVVDSSVQPVYDEIRRHKAAISHVRELAEKKGPLTVDTLKSIYIVLHPEEGDVKTVKYRRDVPQHRLYFHEYAAPDKIAYRVRTVIDWVNDPDNIKNVGVLRVAAKVHYDLARTFPFAQHSGKVARLLMNLVLMRSGFPPAIVHATERQRYYESLKAATPGNLVQMLRDSVDNAVSSIEKLLDEHETNKRGFVS